MSYWEHRKPVQRSRSVDIESISSASVELLDDGGLGALTIRGVAQRLRVAPASLYSRVGSVEDLYDVALDGALGQDAALLRAVEGASVMELMLEFHRHLVEKPWACQVIAMRAPRGPNYLRLSERMCELLVQRGDSDPLGSAYVLSNFVIGSAATHPMAGSERAAPVDAGLAPLYAKLHMEHSVVPETIVRQGLLALLAA